MNFPILLVLSLVFGGVLYYFNGLPQIVGYIFILSLLLLTFILIKKSRNEHYEQAEDELLESAKHDPLYKSITFLIIGVFLLKYGADNLVDGAIEIAAEFRLTVNLRLRSRSCRLAAPSRRALLMRPPAR